MIQTFSSVNEYLISKHQGNLKKQGLFLQKSLSNLNSSYQENEFCHVFSYLVEAYKPKIISEFGVLGCYSIASMALNCRQGVDLFGFDLFEDYPFNSFKLSEAEKILSVFGLDNVTLQKKDIFDDEEWLKSQIIKSDLIHIDLSNDGNTFKHFLNLNSPSELKDKTFIFEGGGNSRDSVEWMSKYEKIPIRPFLYQFSKANHSVQIDLIEEYPSMTILHF